MSNNPTTQLRPATREEIEGALNHALRFDGKKAYQLSSEMTATITAAHLEECLEQARFIIMKASETQVQPSTHGPLGIDRNGEAPGQ